MKCDEAIYGDDRDGLWHCFSHYRSSRGRGSDALKNGEKDYSTSASSLRRFFFFVGPTVGMDAGFPCRGWSNQGAFLFLSWVGAAIFAVVFLWDAHIRVKSCQMAWFSFAMLESMEFNQLSSVQNLCWLVIIGDSTAQYIGDHSNLTWISWKPWHFWAIGAHAHLPWDDKNIAIRSSELHRLTEAT